jgi:hypothetical protein
MSSPQGAKKPRSEIGPSAGSLLKPWRAPTGFLPPVDSDIFAAPTAPDAATRKNNHPDSQ